MKLFSILTFFVFLLLISCKDDDSNATPTVSLQELLYISDSSLFSIDENGNNMKRLSTLNILNQTSLDYSRVNNRLLYINGANGRIADMELFTVNLDGTNPKRITNNNTLETVAEFSNDGTRIAYYFLPPNDSTAGELMIMDADGSNQRAIDFPSTVFDYEVQSISWAPNDSTVLFAGRVMQQGRSTSDGIFSIKLDGTNFLEILGDSLLPSYAAYSPDGKQIVFTGISDFRGHYNVFKMDNEGKNLVQLTQFSRAFGANVHTFYSTWSQDGKKISFNTNVDMPSNVNTGSTKYFEIYTLDENGLNLKRLTTDSLFQYTPIWK